MRLKNILDFRIGDNYSPKHMDMLWTDSLIAVQQVSISLAHLWISEFGQLSSWLPNMFKDTTSSTGILLRMVDSCCRGVQCITVCRITIHSTAGTFSVTYHMIHKGRNGLKIIHTLANKSSAQGYKGNHPKGGPNSLQILNKLVNNFKRQWMHMSLIFSIVGIWTNELLNLVFPSSSHSKLRYCSLVWG